MLARQRRVLAVGVLYLTLGPSLALAQPSQWGRFVGEVITKWDDDNIHFTLTEEFTFIDAKGRVWTANKGLRTDCASIPSAFWPVVGNPCQGVYRKAAVIHDRYCIDKHLATSDDVHEMFFNALMASGATKRQAYTLYSAVYFGGPHWEKVTQPTGKVVIKEYRFLTRMFPDGYSHDIIAAADAIREDDLSAVKKLIESSREVLRVDPKDPRLKDDHPERGVRLKHFYERQ
jgi:hypothetical protein